MTELALFGGSAVRTDPWPRYPIIKDEEIEAAVACMRKHDLCCQMGQEVRAFEAEFAAYCGAAYATATSNGTAALHTALAAAGVGVGDEVIVPPYTFLATATSVLMQNAIPIFADIESETLGLDPQAVAAKVTPRTRAMIVVHMNGIPADMDGLMRVAAKHELTVIEDCSHAHGAEHRGRKVGAIGHVGAFSCQQKKNLSLGEGGLVVTSDAEMAETAKQFVTLGKLPMAFNVRMTELHGAIGRVRLRRLDPENDLRAANAAYLDQALADLPGLDAPPVRPETKPVYYNYVLRYREDQLGVPRAKFIQAVKAEGIPVSPGYYPLYRHQTFHDLDAYGRGCPFRCPLYEPPADEAPTYEDGMCPVAEEICDHQAIELKIHPPAGENEMADAVAAFAKVALNVGELREEAFKP